MDEAGSAGLGIGGLLQSWALFSRARGYPSRMRQDYRNMLPVEKSHPQMLFAGGRKVQSFAVTPRAVWERAHWVQMGWRGSRSTFSIPGPTSVSSVVYEPPSLPLRADSWLPAGGKGYLGGSSLAQGDPQDTHRPAAPFSY